MLAVAGIEVVVAEVVMAVVVASRLTGIRTRAVAFAAGYPKSVLAPSAPRGQGYRGYDTGYKNAFNCRSANNFFSCRHFQPPLFRSIIISTIFLYLFVRLLWLVNKLFYFFLYISCLLYINILWVFFFIMIYICFPLFREVPLSWVVCEKSEESVSLPDHRSLRNFVWCFIKTIYEARYFYLDPVDLYFLCGDLCTFVTSNIQNNI